MKVIIVSKSHDKLSAFFIKSGSLDVEYSIDSITSNIDLLMNNIVHVDKMLILITESMELASEIRSLLTLLNNPSALLRIGEIVLFYKSDMNVLHIKQYITVITDFIKSKSIEDSSWFAPHVSSKELKLLSFDAIYKELLGKSSSTIINPNSKWKYREERGNESKVSFEPSTEIISISPFDNNNLKSHQSLKELLRKTENPVNITALESLVPEYEELKLQEYKGLGYTENKWILMTGDRRSGSSTHATALAVAASKAGKDVLIIDFTDNMDICDNLKVANADYYELSAREALNNSIVLIDDPIVVYKNNNNEVLRTLLPYMQARPNVYDRDLIIILFDLKELSLVLGSLNSRVCSLIISTLMFIEAIDRMLKLNVGKLKTLIWLNDNINSPIRKVKYTLDVIKARSKEAGKEYKFLEPIFFEDFEVESTFFTAIMGVL